MAMQGRVHYYEGYSISDAGSAYKADEADGCGSTVPYECGRWRKLSDFKAGDLMMITDQIGSFVPSPSAFGPNIDELGLRFCDMSSCV